MNFKTKNLNIRRFGGLYDIALTGIKLSDEEANSLNNEKLWSIEIKEFKKQRSISANSYFHLLSNRIAEKQKTTLDEVKFILNVQYGTIETDEDDIPFGFKMLAKLDVKLACKYPKLIKQVEENGKMFNCYIVYKHTSDLNSTEMAKLIDGVISECKDNEIDYLPPCRVLGYEV